MPGLPSSTVEQRTFNPYKYPTGVAAEWPPSGPSRGYVFDPHQADLHIAPRTVPRCRATRNRRRATRNRRHDRRATSAYYPMHDQNAMSKIAHVAPNIADVSSRHLDEPCRTPVTQSRQQPSSRPRTPPGVSPNLGMAETMTDQEWIAKCRRDAEDRTLSLRTREVLAARVSERLHRQAASEPARRPQEGQPGPSTSGAHLLAG